MNKVLFPFLFCGVLFCTLQSCSSDKQSASIQEQIEQLKSTYAPDRRTDRFDITSEKKGDKYVLSGTTTSVKAREVLIQYLDGNAIPYSDRIITYPDSTVGNETWGLVHLSVCNIRSNPKHSAELATQEVMGTKLRVLSRLGEWYLVQTPNRYLGWLDHGGFVRLTDTQIKHWDDQPKHITYVPVGWLVDAPTANADVVSDIVAGSTVIDKQNKMGKFTQVELPDGRTGYLMENQSIKIEGDEGNHLVQTAKRFLGVPYLWGGTSPKGFDCSGYTKTIYNLHGYLLPRDASQQVRVGKLIETDKTWSNLIPGDLLFFGNLRDDGSERITHVAIYIGDGKIIHAAGRVKIESLNPDDEDFAKDRYETFMKARRMVENGEVYGGVERVGDL